LGSPQRLTKASLSKSKIYCSVTSLPTGKFPPEKI
jgi:hypothetical protein